MSSRLEQAINGYVIRAGGSGQEKLCAAADVSLSTLTKIRRGHVPLATTAYKLALAAGCSEEAALAIANECSSERAKETA